MYVFRISRQELLEEMLPTTGVEGGLPTFSVRPAEEELGLNKNVPAVRSVVLGTINAPSKYVKQKHKTYRLYVFAGSR